MRNFPRVIRKYSLLPKRSFLIIFIFFCVLSVCIIIDPQHIFSQNWCKNFVLDDNLSCGEESLFTPDKFPSFQQGNFKDAVNFFEKEKKKDQRNPESLIYLNNAKLMQEGKKSYTIAVIVPVNISIANNMLRGAAQVQDYFNNDPKNPGLKIIIANDENNPGKAENLVKKLLSKQDTIAVIGHYSSDVIAKTLPVYQNKKVVIISSVSATRKDILGIKKYPENFLFKTNTAINHQMDKLIEALTTLGISKDKVAVFYNKNSTFSQSAFKYLQSKFGEYKIIEKPISTDGLNAADSLNDVNKQGGKALILIPDGQVQPESLDNAIKLIEANKDKLPVLGQTVLYNQKILDSIKYTKYVEKFRIITTWSPVTSPNKNVVTRAEKLWGTKYTGVQGGWYYDATVVLTKALTNALKDKSFMNYSVENQRLAIQHQLKLHSFQVTEGASGTISFDQDGDRKEDTSQILKVGFCPQASFLPVESGCPKKPQN